MKANQFASNEEAVSPVIGVILMVAITVVLAAVVFVLVSDLGSTEDGAPDVNYRLQESDDRLQIVTADAGTLWGEFGFTTSAAGEYALGAQMATLEGCAADGSAAKGSYGTAEVTATGCTVADVSGDVMNAGQYIQFCATAATNNVDVTITHIESNTLVATYTFATLAQCVP